MNPHPSTKESVYPWRVASQARNKTPRRVSDAHSARVQVTMQLTEQSAVALATIAARDKSALSVWVAKAINQVVLRRMARDPETQRAVLQVCRAQKIDTSTFEALIEAITIEVNSSTIANNQSPIEPTTHRSSERDIRTTTHASAESRLNRSNNSPAPYLPRANNKPEQLTLGEVCEVDSNE